MLIEWHEEETVGKTVLVVDDLPVNRDLVRTVLGYHGHQTIEARGGQEALALLTHEHPDLVLTDVMMPGMDGFELARAIRADSSTKSIPVLFYTANYLVQEAGGDELSGGITRIVPKTGDLTELIDAVEDALNTWK